MGPPGLGVSKYSASPLVQPQRHAGQRSVQDPVRRLVPQVLRDAVAPAGVDRQLPPGAHEVGPAGGQAGVDGVEEPAVGRLVGEQVDHHVAGRARAGRAWRPPPAAAGPGRRSAGWSSGRGVSLRTTTLPTRTECRSGGAITSARPSHSPHPHDPHPNSAAAANTANGRGGRERRMDRVYLGTGLPTGCVADAGAWKVGDPGHRFLDRGALPSRVGWRGPRRGRCRVPHPGRPPPSPGMRVHPT